MRPPKNTKSNWKIWWLVLISVTFLVVRRMAFFDSNVTWADIIVYVIAFVSAGYGLFRLGGDIYYKKYPFVMKYQEKLHYEDKPKLSEKLVIGIGVTSLLLRIKPKRFTDFGEMHVRLVEKKAWMYVKCPPREKVSVVGLKAEGLLGNISTWTKDDHTNGMQGSFTIEGSPTSYKIAPEEALLLTVTIKSDISWSGYLAVKLQRVDGHIGYSYLPLQVEDKKVVNE
jgi:hypothetical protein